MTTFFMVYVLDHVSIRKFTTLMQFYCIYSIARGLDNGYNQVNWIDFFAPKHYLWENIKKTPTYFESYLQAQLSF